MAVSAAKLKGCIISLVAMATTKFTYFDCFSRTVLSQKISSCYVDDSPSYRGKALQLGFNTAVVTSFGPSLHSKSDCHGVSHVEI